MKITKIVPQKKRKGRWSVFIDEEFAFGITTEDLCHLSIKEGQEITLEKREQIEQVVLYGNAKNKALHFLGYKQRTEKEIKDKLVQEQYSEEVVQQVVRFLYQYKLLDDENYARLYIRDRLRFKPMGERGLIYELQQKGISRDIIQRILEEIEIDEVSVAVELLKKKIKDKNNMTPKEKNRAYQYLLRKG